MTTSKFLHVPNKSFQNSNFDFLVSYLIILCLNSIQARLNFSWRSKWTRLFVIDEPLLMLFHSSRTLFSHLHFLDATWITLIYLWSHFNIISTAIVYSLSPKPFLCPFLMFTYSPLPKLPHHTLYNTNDIALYELVFLFSFFCIL